MEKDQQELTFKSLQDIYSTPSILKEKQSTLEKCMNNFETLYGQKPEFLARAPGRVNIIGEHIDYNGYGVLPFALHKEIWFLFKRNDDKIVRMANSNAKRFPKKEYSVDTKDWETIPGEWTSYIIWGFRSVLFSLSPESENKTEPKNSVLPGFDLFVFSDLPIACGVSSSSALSVGSGLVISKILGVDSTLDKTGFVSNIIKFERHNGLLGGGMDQTISVFGQTGHCLAIEFKPKLSSVQVPMKGLGMVLCNSLTESPKVETGFKRYNKRVFECTMGLLALIRKSLGEGASVKELPTLWDLQKRLGKDLKQMNQLLEEALGNTKGKQWKLKEIYSFLGVKDFREVFGDDKLIEVVTTKNTEFCLYERLKHVFDESLRVNNYISLLSETSSPEQLEKLGRLMTESQESCATLYECSSENLDILTQESLKSGALGSRLTGAGWGGCFISLVPVDKVGV